MSCPSDVKLKYNTLYNRLVRADDKTIQLCIEKFYEVAEKPISLEMYENGLFMVSIMTIHEKKELMCNHLCQEAANRDAIAWLTTGTTGSICDDLLKLTSILNE